MSGRAMLLSARTAVPVECTCAICGYRLYVHGWPEEDQPYSESGKIWFSEGDVESLELLEREEKEEDGG